MMIGFRPLLALLLLLLAVGCDDAGWDRAASQGQSPAPSTTTDGLVTLDWDALIPDDWRPDRLLAEYNVDELSDDDPRARELMQKLRALWREAPVVEGLDGRRVRLPGFVVPLDMEADTITELLLVPYYGACIHVPPPPANQTVHVITERGHEYRGGLFDTVWVIGTLKVEASSSDLADAGYRLVDARLEPYE